jgi:mono/diheme cytochrome c family protein
MTRFGPIFGALTMSGLAFILVVIVLARSPYTHGNLNPQGYDRTTIAFVGDEAPFEGMGLTDPALADTGDPARDGAALFFQYGCASCHGLRAEGATVGTDLDVDDLDLVDFSKEIRRGPKGMPEFLDESLPDSDIEKMYAFLLALAGGLPVDGATPTPAPTPTPAATAPPTAPPSTATPQPTATAGPTPTGSLPPGVHLLATSATITVDGASADWSSIDGLPVTLTQITIPDSSDWDEPNPLADIEATLKVATDADNIYLLLEVPDDYDFVADDHNLSASPNVMFLIESAAGPHMGADGDDVETGLGMVDLWHWELDCGPGADPISGGGDPGSGDDPDCNLDDEYATDPEEREDDGKEGDNPNAENSLAGAWDHTNRASGNGADGTWIFEFSRPLDTGDPEDAQFQSGGTASIALAYFDADETSSGWTDTGHLTSADEGWTVVALP